MAVRFDVPIALTDDLRQSIYERAKFLHEMYTAYIHVGFTDEQAMALVCTEVAASFGKS